MSFERSAGILLHPTSLPGPNGIGELGKEAFEFVDWLCETGIRLWQVLPLGPTGYGDSPYASFSSFAGNPLLISADALVESGDVDSALLVRPPASVPGTADFGSVIAWKLPMLRRAAQCFLGESSFSRLQSFNRFCSEQREWLDDFALFMSVKRVFQEQAEAAGAARCTWNTTWDRAIAWREPPAVEAWSQRLEHEIAVEKVLQFFFREQWLAIKLHANRKGIRIIGDLPIFVAGDSADVWTAPQLFLLDEDGEPEFVAGVPPDYFSADGQNWGNPQYDWKRMKEDGFAWWIRRFRGTAALVDSIRIDHFRGFEKSFFIPGKETTGKVGQWVEVPGAELFETVGRELPGLSVIAEDLGLITPEVDALRERFGFPGMQVLQFVFGTTEDSSGAHPPLQFAENCVVYTGTHDNDTTAGWFASRTPAERKILEDCLGHPVVDAANELLQVAMASRANTAIIPMQDVLGLGSEARMNLPGTASGNWRWRLEAGYEKNARTRTLARLVRDCGRS